MPQQPESSSLTSRPGTRLSAATVPAVPDQRLLLAVAVQQDAAARRASSGRSGTRAGSATKASTSSARDGDQVGVGAEAEVAVLVDQRQQAARLAADDRRARAGAAGPARGRSRGPGRGRA